MFYSICIDYIKPSVKSSVYGAGNMPHRGALRRQRPSVDMRTAPKPEPPYPLDLVYIGDGGKGEGGKPGAWV